MKHKSFEINAARRAIACGSIVLGRDSALRGHGMQNGQALFLCERSAGDFKN
jgi:hypothetical protein